MSRNCWGCFVDRKELEHRLDRLCSTYVRNREKRCFTCGKWLSYDRRQAGHFNPRIIKATRWAYACNIHVQCNRCNVVLGGNLIKYGKKIEQNRPDDFTYLTFIRRKYDNGELREPSYDWMVDCYNILLNRIRRDYPKKAAQFAEWHEIEP